MRELRCCGIIPRLELRVSALSQSEGITSLEEQMADQLKLVLEERSVVGKNVKKLRRAGILPATVYGKGVGPFNVQLDAREFGNLYRHAGRTRLIEVTIPGQLSQSVFIHSLQRHPVSRAIIHVDFHAVDLKTDLVVEVPIHFVGEPALVKSNDATLNHAISSLEIRALPLDIPSAIEVDVSKLEGFDASIHVRDLVAPPRTTIMTPADELVANLVPVRDTAAAPVEEAPAEPELVRERRDADEA